MIICCCYWTYFFCCILRLRVQNYLGIHPMASLIFLVSPKTIPNHSSRSLHPVSSIIEEFLTKIDLDRLASPRDSRHYTIRLVPRRYQLAHSQVSRASYFDCHQCQKHKFDLSNSNCPIFFYSPILKIFFFSFVNLLSFCFASALELEL